MGEERSIVMVRYYIEESFRRDLVMGLGCLYLARCINTLADTSPMLWQGWAYYATQTATDSKGCSSIPNETDQVLIVSWDSVDVYRDTSSSFCPDQSSKPEAVILLLYLHPSLISTAWFTFRMPVLKISGIPTFDVRLVIPFCCLFRIFVSERLKQQVLQHDTRSMAERHENKRSDDPFRAQVSRPSRW